MSIVCYTSDQLSVLPFVHHGFFGRSGGVSEGPFASLNCARESGDQEALVLKNRKRVMAYLGFEDAPLLLAKQEHGIDVCEVKEPWPFDRPPACDILVTRQTDLALGILTADCGPILLVDRHHQVIAACHAGWRGALAGAVEAAVNAMENLGAKKTSLFATVGPCIRQASYEVDAAFYRLFQEKDPFFSQFFKEGSREGTFLFDLPGFLLSRLEALGLAGIDVVEEDTYTGSFFSRRKALHQGQQLYGCGISVIMLSSKGFS